ncbi:hypothetical protein GWI33_018921, partial [Rhynchophorus ferrugineus]
WSSLAPGSDVKQISSSPSTLSPSSGRRDDDGPQFPPAPSRVTCDTCRPPRLYSHRSRPRPLLETLFLVPPSPLDPRFPPRAPSAVRSAAAVLFFVLSRCSVSFRYLFSCKCWKIGSDSGQWNLERSYDKHLFFARCLWTRGLEGCVFCGVSFRLN